jgi:hypothetical protein
VCLVAHGRVVPKRFGRIHPLCYIVAFGGSQGNGVASVVATFPKEGNIGVGNDNSITARLNGLKWLATYGEELPAGVERVLVMDATDLKDLPFTNKDPNLPKGVDVENFRAGKNRKPTRILLRRGSNTQARAAAARGMLGRTWRRFDYGRRLSVGFGTLGCGRCRW